MESNGHSMVAPQERPPNYLGYAIALLVLLSPLCLLLGTSSLYTVWRILDSPWARSETPRLMNAFFEVLRVVVALIGFFVPIKGIFLALKVNSEYDAGNYPGAQAASKSAKSQVRQGVIFMVLIIFIMAVDLLNFLAKK